MDILPFELSLWTFDIGRTMGEGLFPERFTEKKSYVLAASDMDDLRSAYDVKQKININGERTLTFSIHYKIADENGQLYDNPLFEGLVNEAYLKLRDGAAYEREKYVDPETGEITYQSNVDYAIALSTEVDNEEKWYDFVIKNVDKKTQNYEATITAKETFVNELGKNGWGVTLDAQLYNNVGTLYDLATAVLDGSDWTVNPNSYKPTENQSEILFKGYTTFEVAARNCLTKEELTVPVNSLVYLFYSNVVFVDGRWVTKQENENVQFLYPGRELTIDDLDEKYCVIDEDFTYNYEVFNLYATDIVMTGAESGSVSMSGNKVIKGQKTRQDQTLKKAVKSWTVVGEDVQGAEVGSEVFSYTETEEITPTIAKNYITNYRDFTNNAAWDGEAQGVARDATLKTYPILDPNNIETFNYLGINYLQLDFSNNAWFQNKGLFTNKLAVVQDEIYVIRMRGRFIKKDGYYWNEDDIPLFNQNFTFSIKRYESSTRDTPAYATGKIEINTSKLYTSGEYKGYLKPSSGIERRVLYDGTNLNTTYVDENGYAYSYIKIDTTSSKVQDSLRLHFSLDNYTDISDEYVYCLEEMQFFPYLKGLVMNENENVNDTQVITNIETVLFPTDPINAGMNEKEVFFNYNNDNEIVYLTCDQSNYEPIYYDNYEMSRTFSTKQSNYFNNIQSLAEKFEVWAKFHVKHYKNGHLYIDESGNYVKEITFSRYSPNGEVINYAGFKLGYNESNITRKTDSTSVATKIIVTNNSQEFALNGTGLCSIGRATINPTGENEIYNFNYYIDNGLLKLEDVNLDLYGENGYYQLLKQKNNEYVEIEDAYQSALMSYHENKALVTQYEAQLLSLEEQIAKQLEQIELMEGREDDKRYRSTLVAYNQNLSSQASYQEIYEVVNDLMLYYEDLLNTYDQQMKQIVEEKTKIKKAFYRKYSQFILEGTWTDNSYIDDEKYYIDGVKVAEKSSRPKITYTFNMMDISAIDEYKQYTFKVGERSYLEDTDFFGYKYVNINGREIKTPNRINVIVSETTINYDNPSKSQIVIKTYKNQYEDLFRKLSASSQSLQYSKSDYERAAGAINPNSTFSQDYLENTFAQNEMVLTNDANESVQWNTNQGITLTDVNNQENLIKLIGKGLYLSKDGGETWAAAVTGEGISADYLRAGTIDASQINIMSSGDEPFFRWDKDGIRAYNNAVEDSQNRYVGYNKYGFYGTMNGNHLEQKLEEAGDDFLAQLNALKRYVNFSLTWEGLRINYDDVDNTDNNSSGVLTEPKGSIIINDKGFTISYGDQVLFGVDEHGKLKISGDPIIEGYSPDSFAGYDANIDNDGYRYMNGGNIKMSPNGMDTALNGNTIRSSFMALTEDGSSNSNFLIRRSDGRMYSNKSVGYNSYMWYPTIILKSPDGNIQKQLTINNNGEIELINV